MREIGGYIELDTYGLPMLHQDAIALNCGRNCLAYLLESRRIRKIRLPYFLCDAVTGVCRREGVAIRQYHIGTDFRPKDDLELEEDEWLYLVNFYGQLEESVLMNHVLKYGRVIVDQAHGYYEKPIPHVDTIYTCRKWFGVSDGAFLYTDVLLERPLPQDESWSRMSFLLGRYERPASEFFREYQENNKRFDEDPIKRMSKLTMNLLHGIDYEDVRRRREENFTYLQDKLEKYNQLTLRPGLFMYPLMVENGAAIRRKLLEEHLYISKLWPSVKAVVQPESAEYRMAENILPIPIDQRYRISDMEYLAGRIIENL